MQDQSCNSDKRKKIVHDFAKRTALSALRSGSPLKSAKQVYGLIENHADLNRLFDDPRDITQNEFDHGHEQPVYTFVGVESGL